VYDSDVEEAVQEQAAAAAKRSASSSKDAPASKKLKLSTGEAPQAVMPTSTMFACAPCPQAPFCRTPSPFPVIVVVIIVMELLHPWLQLDVGTLSLSLLASA
jgi:hypothetical protein